MLYGNALFLQNCGSAHCFLGADRGGQQNDVIAFAQHAGTVELHRLICREQTRNFLAEHADVDRTVVVVCQIEHAFDFGAHIVGTTVDAIPRAPFVLMREVDRFLADSVTDRVVNHVSITLE